MLTALLLAAASLHAQTPCGVKPLPSTRPAHGRNIFAFEREPVVVVPTVVAPRVPAPVPIVVVEPVAPPPPKFTYRYIGRFGPDANPIATFTRDGEVLLAHAGDTIDAHFVLRRIGIESVEVGRVEGGVETIGIGQ